MSVRYFRQFIVIAGISAAQVGALSAATKTEAGGKSPASAARPILEETVTAAKSRIGDLEADDLIDEILGLPKSRPDASPKRTVAKAVTYGSAMNRQAGQETPAVATREATASGRLNGRIVSVNTNTATVDIEFEGPQRPTVGSQFSVHHDYALSTSHVGRLEVVYLASNGRAIARPAGRTDLTKIGKGNRINGRIVPGKTSGQQTASPAARSCVAPPSGTEMPVPPPDPSVPAEPNVPDDSAPSPGDEFQAAGPKLKSLLTSWIKSSGDEPNAASPPRAEPPAPSTGNSWTTLLKLNHDRPKSAGSRRSPAPGIVLLED